MVGLLRTSPVGGMTAGEWTAIVVAILAAAASIAATVIAARTQRSVSLALAEAERLRAMEARNDERKYVVYKLMVDHLHFILLNNDVELPPDELERVRRMGIDFGTWLSVFGSDDALQAYHNWCQCFVFQPAYSYPPPPWPVVYRLMADLLLVARHDIGRPDGAVARRELLGLRLTNMYVEADVLAALALPLDEVFQRNNWQPPWQR